MKSAILKTSSPGSFGSCSVTACLVMGLLGSSGALAAGQVSSVQISEQPATPFSYSVGGVEYNWGRGNNQLLEGFSSGGKNFTYVMSANEVLIQRDDLNGIASGTPCGIFVEELSHSSQAHTYAADFPSDGSEAGNCQLASLLESRIINRGLVDAFSNKYPDAKNIERLDYLFVYGALTPATALQMSMAGHIVSEKRGNNAVKIAAVLSLDVFGQPDEYGPLVLVSEAGCTDPEICYGATDLVHDYSFLQNEFNAPQGFPVETERAREALNMAFISTADLGLSPGQLYHGVSIFADDVNADIHDLVDPSTFPDDTSDDYIVLGDDADIYGGLTGYFLADELNIAAGRLFLDVDLDGMPDPDEAGVSDISLSLYSDFNGNGLLDTGEDEQLGDTLISNSDGTFVFPGVPDGNYLVVLDEADPEIPAGLTVAPGMNPHPLTISGVDSEPVYFAFVSDSDTGSGSVSDGDEDGTEDPDVNSPGDSDGDDTGTDNPDVNGPGDSDGDDTGTDNPDVNGPGDSDGPAEPNDGDPDTGAGSGGDGPLADDATAANSDSFDVNQGQSIIYDVLANDTDGTGAGLKLLPIENSPNATISITDDNKVLYVPDYGYYSAEGQPDTFTYTMQDSEGTKRTGNVSATVVRYSDLNGNMLNDYLECNCSDLVLETGVNGSGVGSLSRFMLFALALLALWRMSVATVAVRIRSKGGE